MCTNNNPLYLNIIFDETHPELIDLHENLQEYTSGKPVPNILRIIHKYLT